MSTDDEYFEYRKASMLLQYRDQFCRICLNHFKDGSLISVDTGIQDITLMEMFIELTALETADNDAFPRVICLQCKHKLELAFGTRQEFIARTGHLLKLVAEQKIMSYFDEFLFEPDAEQEPTAADESTVEKPFVTNKTICTEKHSNDHSSYTKIFDEFDLYCKDQETVLEQKRMARTEHEKNRSRERYLAAKAKKQEEPNVWKSFAPTTCYICDKQHDSIAQRDYHLREHVPMLPYQCYECSSTVDEDDSHAIDNPARNKQIILKTTAQLNIHFRMHRMPHKCEHCFRRFSTAQNLRSHLWSTHKNAEDGSVCEYCGKRYFHRRHFNAHVSMHRNKLSEQFKCTICERSFGDKVLLQRHQRSHTGEKKYKCVYCDRSFSRACNRLTHQRTHTGERSYKCSDCDLAFVDSTQLRNHRLTHYRPWSNLRRTTLPFIIDDTRTKHYTCLYEGCTFTTTIGQKMSMHKANHIRRFECDECAKRFANGTRLKRHKESMHSGKEKRRNYGLADPPTLAGYKNVSSQSIAKNWYIIEEECATECNNFMPDLNF